MDILPDSRLKVPTGTVMGDIKLPDGTTRRIEWEKAYCVKCGEATHWVPKENTIAATFICQPCYDADPTIFQGYVASDEQFCQDVAYEMMERFGKALTELEIVEATKDGNLGEALLALERDSPFPANDNRPKR